MNSSCVSALGADPPLPPLPEVFPVAASTSLFYLSCNVIKNDGILLSDNGCSSQRFHSQLSGLTAALRARHMPCVAASARAEHRAL